MGSINSLRISKTNSTGVSSRLINRVRIWGEGMGGTLSLWFRINFRRVIVLLRMLRTSLWVIILILTVISMVR